MTDKQASLTMDELLILWRQRSGFHEEMNAKIIQADNNNVLLKMPFNSDFCADTDKELIHGGVLTALIDSALGLATMLAVPGLKTLATLDLRVEYLRPAKSRSDLMVFAECYRVSRHISFNRGRVWFDGDEKTQVAAGYATFALTRGDKLQVLNRQEKTQ